MIFFHLLLRQLVQDLYKSKALLKTQRSDVSDEDPEDVGRNKVKDGLKSTYKIAQHHGIEIKKSPQISQFLQEIYDFTMFK